MKRRLIPAFLGAALVAAPAAHAVDHNNVDAGRPLRFDDADAIAYRERAFEYGVGLSARRGRALGLGFSAEYLYGFALNSHLSLDADVSLGGRAGSDDTRLDLSEIGIGAFHNFNREYNGTPALAFRGDVFLPAARGGGGAQFRLRGILSKTARQYSRLHLNVDANFAPGADGNERRFRPGVTLGYSAPLGYPARFDRTGLAEVSVQSSEEKGKGPVVAVGVGLRQQVTVRSVLDVGLQSEISAPAGAARETLRVVAGYSTAF